MRKRLPILAALAAAFALAIALTQAIPASGVSGLTSPAEITAVSNVPPHGASPPEPAVMMPSGTPDDRMPPSARMNVPQVYWSHYRLGDSPTDAGGRLEWTRPETLRDWNRMPSTRNTVDGEEYIWLAGMLPTGPGNRPEPDAYLLFTAATYDFELYSGTVLLYRHGDMEKGADRLHAEQSVFVPLANHVPSQPLMLRIHSLRNNVLMGKISPVLYGSQSELKLNLIRQDMLNVLLLLVFFMIGFVALLMYLINRDSTDTLYFALFALSMCIHRLLFSLKSPVLFVDDYSLRLYLQEPLGGIMIYLFTLYFVAVLKPSFHRGMHILGRMMAAGGLATLAVKLAAPEMWERYSGQIADMERLGFSALCALCLIIIALSLRRRIDSDARWFISGFSFYLLVNMIGHPLRPYIEHHVEQMEFGPIEFNRFLNESLDYSLLVCTFFFGIITFKRYAEVYRKMRSYNLQLASWNQTLESTVRERTRALQNLLDHAGQGFLTINEHLIVRKEYSQECRHLFGREIGGASYVELMSPDDADEQKLQAEILQSVFQGDELQREVCLSLLPEDAEVRGRRVALQYKWIPGHETASGKVMVILTDISERRQLEIQMAKERQILRMVVLVVKHYRDFKEMLEEYSLFARKGFKQLMSAGLTVQDKCAELSRAVHTFKGNFSQLEFENTAKKLHEFESQLDEWKAKIAESEPSANAGADFEKWCSEHDLLGWLEDDMRILRDILGDHFDIEQETVTIKLQRLAQLEQRVYAMLPDPEARMMAAELRKLRHRPFRELLGMYPEHAVRLAEKSGKEIYPVQISGGEQLVDPHVYTEFARTLIHVFRNMIDHGIEPPEERISLGKDRRGTIVCEISGAEQEIRLLLSNNGREIDLDSIRQTAIAKSLVKPAELAAMSEDEQRMLIFRDGFTTKRTVGGLSGRGVGLAAVRKALEDINGTVQIKSSANFGTAFLFTIPLTEAPQGQRF